jgi:hypothetical protein
MITDLRFARTFAPTVALGGLIALFAGCGDGPAPNADTDGGATDAATEPGDVQSTDAGDAGSADADEVSTHVGDASSDVSDSADSADSADTAGRADAPAPVAATVTVDHTTPVANLDSTFAGFSYEKSTLNQPLFQGDNAGLIALFARLGPGLLRVGGNSVDQNTWTPTGAGRTAKQIAPADVDRLAAFLKAANWKVIYGVNMGASTPDVAAAEAAYAATSLGDRLFGLEIGNEPDVYHGAYRPKTYAYADFKTEWASFASAVRAKTPSIVLTGPASAYNYAGYTVPFAHDEASLISLLTQHYYIADGRLPTSTIDKMLAHDPALDAMLTALRGAALPGGFRLAEANSFYAGGAPGISDSYASALWAIDFLFDVAAGGGTGVNFHGGGSGTGYTPIANDGAGAVIEARAEYYGISLFSLAANGKLVGAKTTGGTATWTAYAVDATDGASEVIIDNKDPSASMTVTIDLGKAATTATLTRLEGTSLSAATGMTLAGVPIGADGSWTPGPLPTATISGTKVVVDVAPASAVFVKAH